MSAEEEVLAHLMTPMFKTEPAALGLIDAFRAEVLREAAAKIRREVQAFKDDGILEPDKDWTASGAADLIDPDKEG